MSIGFAGCTIYEAPRVGTCPGEHEQKSSEATIAVADTASSSVVDDGPPPAYPPAEEGQFEVVARVVLKSIPYKDCGSGGPGDVDVTFAPSGAVLKVVVWADAWQDSTKQCVAERFAWSHVVPFGGDARTVRWHALLSTGGSWDS